MTFASVILLSGLWAMWYTPTTTYEPRRNQQITAVELVVQPDNATTHAFEVKEGVDEITVNVWPQTILDEPYDPEQPPPDRPPMISIRVEDAQGRAVRSYDNVSSLPDGEIIAIDDPGDFKISLTNNAENAVRVEIRVNDITRVSNHPLEAMGQWLTIISAPVFGLAIWFIIRSRQRSVDER